MAEIAASFVGPVIEVVKWIGGPIKRQFNYLCCFTTNIATLKHEAEKLENAAAGLQRQVDRARDNVEVIVPEVETWIKRSDDIKDLKNKILGEVRNVESGCSKLGARFSLSKRAKKTTDRIIEHLDEKKFDVVSYPGPPAAAEPVLLGTTYEFESRKQIEEGIMTSLRGGDVNMIGICGMGGLGKTTMAKTLMNRALEDHVFEEVVMAVVSQPVDKLKIQVEIGERLGLKKLQEETSMANRAQTLHKRLTAGTKRILLVLDDVWERLELEELGIPRGCKGCTILLTSRNSDTLSGMNVEKVFGMKILSEEEAWFLFRERAGTCVDDAQLNSLVKQVVKECSGLPIALITVGAALKDEKNASIWEDALRQLTQSNPDIPDVIVKVYNPLKLSYNALGSKHAKSVFLLCCLFREDANISEEWLTCFCMGLGIFEGSIRNLEEARNRVCALTKMLKSRSLLLDTGSKEYGYDSVRMHDVVRDVCIFIAKQEEYIGGNDCTWISSLQQVGERTKLPTNLRLLLLSGDSDIEEEFKLQGSSFLEGIRNLHVLFIEKYSSLTSLPHTTQSLRNLKTLVLRSCERLETISIVSNLSSIHIYNCPRLRNLGQFSIAGNDCLSQLEILVIQDCRWMKQVFLWNEEEDQNISNSESTITKMFPKLKKVELYNLPNLVTLCEGIEGIEFPLLTTMEIQKCPKMKSMVSSNNEKKAGGSSNADIDDHHYSHLFCRPQKVSFGNNLENLVTDRNPFCGHKIDVSLFIRLEYLYISGCEGNMSLFSPSIAGNLVNLKELSICFCDELVQMIKDEEKAVSGDGQRTPLLFPKLQELYLWNLPKLVSFCEWKCDVELPSLRKVDISYCPNMKHFTLGLLTTPKLEIVEINDDDFGGVKDLNEIKDLNETLQQHATDLNDTLLEQYYLAKALEEQEEEESDEEEQETKDDQIEEEHNS